MNVSKRRNFLIAFICLLGGLLGLIMGYIADGGRNIVGEIAIPAGIVLLLVCIVFIVLGIRG